MLLRTRLVFSSHIRSASGSGKGAPQLQRRQYPGAVQRVTNTFAFFAVCPPKQVPPIDIYLLLPNTHHFPTIPTLHDIAVH